jgi:hypothetical protein
MPDSAILTNAATMFLLICPTCEGWGELEADGAPSIWVSTNPEPERVCPKCKGLGYVPVSPDEVTHEADLRLCRRISG